MLDAPPPAGRARPPWRLDPALHANLTRWTAHVLFWGGYFLFRSSAAAAQPPDLEEAGDFPFLTNRALVVATYFAMTSALLALTTAFGARLKGRRHALLIVGALALEPIAQFIEEAWPRALMPMPESSPWPFVVYFFQFGWVLPIWGLMMALLGYHFDAVAQARAVARAQALAYDAQLRALHYQINPHFLFNTLNAISTLVLDRHNDLAERMLLRLSGFLRYSLDRNPNELAALADEIEAQRKYLEIEQTRFGDKLTVAFAIEPGLEQVRLPSLILQPILENAIKYAITPSVEGGRIEITARREGDLLRIFVDDDGPGLAASASGRRRGVGLANTKERLELIYGDRAGLIARERAPKGCRVELWLPLEEDSVESAIAHSVG